MNVLTKHQNYRLWQAGAFGNKLRAWTLTEFLYNPFLGKVALRTLQGGGGPCAYNLDLSEADSLSVRWRLAGIPAEAIMVNEMGPDNAIVLQGEYLNDIVCDEEGFALPGYFFYSTVVKPMRDALHERGEHTYGLRADIMLREAMTPSSYEDWRVLLDQYPGHVLEVSVYNRCLGDIPGRNALVWEVRRY